MHANVSAQTMKTTAPHIPIETLADLAEKLIVDNQFQEERGETSKHLSSCGECTTTFQRLRQTISLMKTDREPDAPRSLLAYAVNIFDRRRAANTASILRRVVAALTFDSRTISVAGVRVRSGQSGSRQLVYSAEGLDVELRLSMHEDKWSLAGQVLSAGCGRRADLSLLNSAESSEIKPKVLNELCEFSFPPCRREVTSFIYAFRTWKWKFPSLN